MTPPLAVRTGPDPTWQSRWLAQTRRAVLFDLDGTLLDTSADLGRAANQLRVDEGLEPLPLEVLRPHCSKGARGLIGVALGKTPTDPDYESLRLRFLEIYSADLSRGTVFMPGLDRVISAIEAAGLPWGVVTNKFEAYTFPLLEQLRLRSRMATVVCGDTTEFAKPHPAPMRRAISELGLPAEACVYIGDDLRDIESGRAAGCWTIAAAFGFCSSDLPPQDWGADALAHDAGFLSALLALGNTSA